MPKAKRLYTPFPGTPALQSPWDAPELMVEPEPTQQSINMAVEDDSLTGASRAQAATKMRTPASAPAAPRAAMPSSGGGELQRFIDQIEGTKLVQEQKGRLQNMEDYTGDVLQNLPVQVDQSPFLALADAWSKNKGNLLSGYNKPMAPEERAKVLLGYAQKNADSRQEMLNKILGAADNMRAGRAATAAIRGQAMDEKYVIDNSKKLQTEFLESQSRLQGLDDALSSGNLDAVKRSLSMAAREISGEKGVLTDSDIGRILPQTIGMKADELTAYFTNDPQILITPGVVEGLKKDVRRAAERNGIKYAQRLQGFKDQLAASTSYSKLNVPGLLAPVEQSFRDGLKKEETPPAPGGLQPGHEEDGHIYMGGDPQDPNNWKKK